MHKRIFLTTCVLVACASEPTSSDFGESDGETDATSGTATSSTQASGGTGDAGSDSVGPGTSDSDGTSGGTVGPGSDSDFSSGTGGTAGGGTGTATGGTTGATDGTSASGTSGSTGSTSAGGTTGGVGEMQFPGDLCDPFADECIDAGGNYECQRDAIMLPQNVYETVFMCKLLNESQGDGEYGASCGLYPNAQCVTGLWCQSDIFFHPNGCASGLCCTDVCVYQEICGNGKECEVLIWQADLADYLDQYIGIGRCPQ
jgi:hypothetical protein